MHAIDLELEDDQEMERGKKKKKQWMMLKEKLVKYRKVQNSLKLLI
jgi:hypothetical protein